MNPSDEIIWQCEKCSGIDVERLLWTNANTGVVSEENNLHLCDEWCNTCGENTSLIDSNEI